MHTYGHTHTHTLSGIHLTQYHETGHSPARTHQLFDVTTKECLNVKLNGGAYERLLLISSSV